MKNLTSIIAFVAAVVFHCNIAGCGDTNVTNNYGSDAATIVNNTTNNTTTNNNFVPDGGGTTIVQVTNNYYGIEPDGGVTVNVNVIIASPDGGTMNALDTGSVSVADAKPIIDSTPQATPDSSPATADKDLLKLRGGERMLDGTNGKFAWLQTDGAIMAYDSKTDTLRSINSPMAGSGGSFSFYEAVTSLAVNQDGKVGWIKRSYTNMDSKQYTCMYAMVESEISEGICSFPAGNYGFDGSIAYHDNVLYWAMSTDQYGTIRGGRWVMPSIEPSKRMSTPFAVDEQNGIFQLRSHSYGTVGYMAHGQYMLMDVMSAVEANLVKPKSVASFGYALKMDFSATSLIVKQSYNGQFSISITDKTGYQTHSLDSGSEYSSSCSRCVALSWGDTIAAWSVNGGVKYQRIDQDDSKAVFIPGATEFVVEDNALYYIGSDAKGDQHLYGRRVN